MSYNKFLIIFLLINIPVISYSLERPMETEAYKYYEMLMNGSYETIEKDAEMSLKNGLTISDGQPRLAAIFGGISGCQFFKCDFPATEDEWKAKKTILEEWLEQNPDSSVAQIANAYYYVDLAWFYRGGGYSNTVTKEGRKKFIEFTEIGREELLKLEKPTKSHAAWYQAMLQVGLNQGWPLELFNAIYYEAVEKYPEYIPFYFIKGAFVEPKWYGTKKSYNEYVEEVIEKTQSIYGQQMYARLHWSSRDSKMFKSGKTDWNRMKIGFEEMISKFPDRWNKYNFLMFACYAYDFSKVTEIFGLLEGDNPEPDWVYYKPYNQCKKYTPYYNTK